MFRNIAIFEKVMNQIRKGRSLKKKNSKNEYLSVFVKFSRASVWNKTAIRLCYVEYEVGSTFICRKEIEKNKQKQKANNWLIER